MIGAESLKNSFAYFQVLGSNPSPLIFDISAGKVKEFELGQVVTALPYDSQDLTLSLDAAPFFSIVRDFNDIFVLKFANEQAVEGNYEIKVQILIQNGSSSPESFTILVPITLIKEIEALVETENEESTNEEEIKYENEVKLNVQP